MCSIVLELEIFFGLRKPEGRRQHLFYAEYIKQDEYSQKTDIKGRERIDESE
jgi:hypothetical protein